MSKTIQSQINKLQKEKKSLTLEQSKIKDKILENQKQRYKTNFVRSKNGITAEEYCIMNTCLLNEFFQLEQEFKNIENKLTDIVTNLSRLKNEF